MKIVCRNCRRDLVGKSLYHSKKWNRYDEVDYGDEDEPDIEGRYEVSRGSFIPTRSWYDNAKIINVNRDDLIIPIPIYKSGMGCCDVSRYPVHCTCGSELGTMDYDCWQSTHSIGLEFKKVELVNVE